MEGVLTRRDLAHLLTHDFIRCLKMKGLLWGNRGWFWRVKTCSDFTTYLQKKAKVNPFIFTYYLWVAVILTYSKPLIFNFLSNLCNRMEGFESDCLPFLFVFRELLVQTNLGSRNKLIWYSLLHTSNDRTTPFLISLSLKKSWLNEQMPVRNVYLQCVHTWGKLFWDSMCFEIIGFGSCHFFFPHWLYLFQLCISPTTEMDAFEFVPCFPSTQWNPIRKQTSTYNLSPSRAQFGGFGPTSEWKGSLNFICPSQWAMKPILLWFCFLNPVSLYFYEFTMQVTRKIWTILCLLYHITKYIKIVKH